MSTNPDTTKLTGQCLCGGIKYEVSNLQPTMAHCHCSMCRKFHGAAFGTYGVVKVENFKWLQGGELLKTYTAPNGTKRQFCSECGSSLTFAPINDDGTHIEFTLGTLDSEITVKPDSHIYCSYKADWYEIADDLPQFPEGRES
ncbi:GFA family protein [Neptuniibacter sp. QD29_5]|uniref:GFA family protein n=1 Tax=Neptuniibacter sp. QD29_5 TaxID=3398207 RepID=UPI0039F47315